MKPGNIVLFTTFIILLTLPSACKTTSQQAPVTKDGKTYGVTEGAFRHRWWNYYERAMSFADGGFYDKAIQDLEAALNQREKDQRRARTYGMHFVDYFPHRELGVVFYQQGRMQSAIDELTRSLKTVKTAKAELYLDRARKALIQQQKIDLKPPDIHIQSPAPNFLCNTLTVTVSGTARDDTFVKEITVAGDPVRIDVSDKEVPFSRKVKVRNGLNRIPVRVTDISGKVGETEVMVNVDRAGPILRIDSPSEGVPPSGKTVRVEGYAFDDSGLATLGINGRQFPCEGQELRFGKNVPVPSDGCGFLVQAKDKAGNITTASIEWSPGTGLAVQPKGPPGGPDRNPPVVSLRDIPDEQATYLDEAFVEGCVKDDKQVGRILVNDSQILRSPCKKAYFSHLVGLREGENEIHIKGMDLSGNARDKTIKILRDILNVRQTGARLCVAVGAFNRKTIGKSQDLSLGMEDLLTADMKKRKRFRAVDRRRLKEVLKELKLSQSGLVDEDSALKAGRILAADCMLFGSVLERKDSVEIYVRLVDTETTEVLAATDVYGEDLDIGKLRELSRGLDVKLTDALPVLEGKVVKIDGNRIITDLGKNSRVSEGMKLIVFEIGDIIRNPADGSIMGIDVKKLGQARIESVMEKMSFADLIGETKSRRIRPMHSVITR